MPAPELFQYDADRAQHVVAWWVARYGMNRPRMLESIAAADLIHLQRYGRPIVGGHYQMTVWGAVAIELSEALKDERFRQVQYNPDHLSQSDLEILVEVSPFCSQDSGPAPSDETARQAIHSIPPFEGWSGSLISAVGVLSLLDLGVLDDNTVQALLDASECMASLHQAELLKASSVFTARSVELIALHDRLFASPAGQDLKARMPPIRLAIDRFLDEDEPLDIPTVRAFLEEFGDHLRRSW